MYRLVWTEPAVHDLDAILDYIALDNPRAANRLNRLLFARLRVLRDFPFLGSVPRELKKLPYRQLMVSPCRIFYKVEGRIIYVVAVMRTERQLKLNLLTRS